MESIRTASIECGVALSAIAVRPFDVYVHILRVIYAAHLHMARCGEENEQNRNNYLSAVHIICMVTLCDGTFFFFSAVKFVVLICGVIHSHFTIKRLYSERSQPERATSSATYSDSAVFVWRILR